MFSFLFKYWHRFGFVIMPDLYTERFRQFPWYYKLFHSYDIIRLKRLYKKDRKKYGISYSLGNVYDYVDRYITKYNNQMNPTITCKKGCAYCCSIEVFISDDEAKILYDYSLKNNIPIDLSKAHYQAINKFNVPLTHKSCIFLDSQTQECKVYDVRPLSCRMLFSSSEPKVCFNNKFERPLYFLLPKMENIKTAIWNSSISGILPAMFMKQIFDNQEKIKVGE